MFLSNSVDMMKNLLQLLQTPQLRSNYLRSWLKENLLLVITFSGVFLGVLIGIALKPLDLDNMSISYIAYPGELFMRLLKLMILPLIIASLITGMIIFDRELR